VYAQTSRVLSIPLPLRASRVVVCPRFTLGRLTWWFHSWSKQGKECHPLSITWSPPPHCSVEEGLSIWDAHWS
ncbi:hypothetical protein SCLCIDRAFT_1184516, partial [Scleroderma citrinum Foug A]